MTCDESRDLLPLHLAGELGDDADLLSHLALCGWCARRAEMAGVVWHLAGLAPDEPVPDAAVQGVYDAIEGARRRPQRIVLTLLRRGTVAAAALLFIAGAVRLLPQEPGREMRMEGDESQPGALEPALGRIEAGEDGARGPLALRSHAVTVEIGDWSMRTEVEEVFFNASDARLEGTFTFPLPPDASLSRFAMEVEGKLVEGELVERVRAREVYEGIVRQMKDPALLEWMPGNIFKARIFPLEPWSEKRVVLSYTQAPRMSNGALTYVYPLVSEKTRDHPPEELSVRAALRFARPIARLSCAAPAADVVHRDGRTARVALALRNARPRADFQVRVELAPEELATASHRPAGEDGYLGVAFAPPAEGAGAGPGTFLFVLDRSTRMGEADLEAARRVVDEMIGHLGPGDRAGVMAHHVEAVGGALHEAGPERRPAWRKFLAGLRGEGASDVLGALRAAARAAPEGATVVYVGKGVPTYGELDAARVAAEGAAALAGQTFRAVAVGSGVNEEGLERVAGSLGGGVQKIVPGGDLTAEIAAIARTIRTRPLRDVELRVEGAQLGEVHPERFGAVYPGERVFFFARYAGIEAPRRVRVSVRGMREGRGVERAAEAELASGPSEHGGLVRLWAGRALAARVEECRLQGEPRGAVEAVIEMSRRMQVMTPYTSFLVLENEEAYRQHRIERAKRRQEESGREDEQRRRLGTEAVADGREVFGRIADLLELSYMAFDQKRYGRCIQLCDEILLIDPRYSVARELKEEVQKTRHKEEYHGLVASKVEGWKRLTDSGAGMVPHSQTVRRPSSEEWAEISRRLTERVIKTSGEPGPVTEEFRHPVDQALVRHQQVLLGIDDAEKRGARAYNRGDFAAAEQEFRKVVEYARWMPAGVELEGRRRTALEMLERTSRQAVDGQRELELLSGQAAMHFEREEYGRAIEAADGMLRINPNLANVTEMKDLIGRLQHMKPSGELRRYLAEWRRTWQAEERAGTVVGGPTPAVRDFDLQIATGSPRLDPLVREAPRRKPKGVASLDESLEPEDREISDKLSSIRVALDMSNAPLPAVVDYLREISGLNMAIDTRAIPTPAEERVSIRASDIPLEEALRRILEPLGHGHEVRGGVVMVTSARAALAGLRLELYDVQDLTLDASPSSSAELADLVKRSLGPSAWDEAAGRTVEGRNGILIVRNAGEVHGRVRELLRGMRGKVRALRDLEARLEEMRAKVALLQGRAGPPR